MAEPVIHVEQLGKKYRIGKVEKKADTITGAILNGLKSPLANLKQIRNLSRLDGEDDSIFWALRDVSFKVQEGEVLGIIGHNGAGKSTLLKILSQITEPSTGEVRIRGRVAALLEVGTGFHPELTGRENIYMNGTILGMRKKEIDKKLDEIVDFSGVAQYLDTPVKFYSSGMRVRLGFAVAAHLEPEILIIDEVLSVGDAEFQKKCLGKMEDVSITGRTVIFVSHNMAAVQNLCHRGVVLKKGMVKYVGPIADAVNAYLGEYSTQQMELVARGEAEFENDRIRFLSARILNQKPLETSEDILFEFRFEYKGTESPILDVTYHLYDELNTLVFVASSAFDHNERPDKNIMVFQSTIPGNLLQEGNYKLARLIFVQDKGYVLLNINDAIVFDVLPTSRGGLGWMGTKEGVVKPKLKWTVSNDTRN